MKHLIALVVAVLSIGANAQERSAVANNAALWYEAFHRNDPALLDRILADQWVDIPPAPGQPPGPQGAKQILTELRIAFPDLTIEIRDVIQQGNKVVVRSEIAGTQQGPFLGRASKGRKLKIQAIDIHEFQNDKIVRTWHSEDWMTGLHQLGILE
jgi:predicted ester cyclase